MTRSLRAPLGAGLLASAAGIAALVAGLGWQEPARAAKSDGCAGGGFAVLGFANGAPLAASGTTVVSAAQIGSVLQVRGRYIHFDIVPATFGIRNYAFTGAANPEDITGGRRTPVWAEKTPNHRGLSLNGNVTITIDEDAIEVNRSGTGLKMKIQAKDCAQGGIFQMEPERGDRTATRITHVLDASAFYFDNPNFRAREGDAVPFKDTTVVVTPRINIANDLSRKFVTRDSAQVAERVDEPTCTNLIRTRTGALEEVQHCGRVSRWDVASGGRMGFVTGEDAIEVAPPPTDCVRKCQAQNRVRGQSTKLNFPFPVPAASRLKPPAP
jgi:hypothetical protein